MLMLFATAQSGRLDERRTSSCGAEAAASARTTPARGGAFPSEPSAAARAISRSATSIGAALYSAAAASKISMASCVRPSAARACATASHMHRMRAVRQYRGQQSNWRTLGKRTSHFGDSFSVTQHVMQVAELDEQAGMRFRI